MASFNQTGMIYPLSFFPGYFYTKKRYDNMTEMEVPPSVTRASQAQQGSMDTSILFLGEIQPPDKIPVVSAGLRDQIKSAPAVVVNLEAPLSARYRKPLFAPPFPSFSMTVTAFRATLVALGITPSKCIVNLANNHAYDLGKQSLQTTTKHLLTLGCRVIGTRDHPSVMVSGVRIMGCTSRMNPLTHEHADTLVQPDDVPLYDNIPTIMYVHWGWEYYDEPDDQTRALAAHWCRPSTNIMAIIGHGPHLLQRVQVIGGRPVFYSLGDTVSHATMELGNPRSLSGALSVAVKNGALKGYTLMPILQGTRIADTPDSLRRFRAFYR
jgi:hypothetical protein